MSGPETPILHTRSAKVLVLSSGQLLTALVGLISMSALARVFSQRDYATYRQTLLAYSFAAPFAAMGLNRALYFFLPGERQRPRALLVENLALVGAGGALLMLFVLLGGNHVLAQRMNNPDLAPILLLMAPYPLFQLPTWSVEPCLMARDRAEQVCAFNVGSRLVMLAFVLLPALVWARPAAAVAGTLLGSAVVAAAAVTLMLRACPEGPWLPSRAGMAAQLAFAAPLGLAGVAGTLAGSLGQLLVSLRCAPEAFAVYSIGAMEVPLVGIITGSITSVVTVDYARDYREGRLDEVVALVHRAMVKSATLLLPMMVFLLCLAPDLMCVLFGEKYAGSAAPFRVYLLLLPMRTITFSAVLQAAGKTRQVLVQSLLGLAVGAGLGWLAIGRMGPVGAAWATVATSYLVCVPYYMAAIRSTLQVPLRRMFPWAELLKVAATTIIPGAALELVALAAWPRIARLAAGGVVFAGLWLAILELTGRARISDGLSALRALWERPAGRRSAPGTPWETSR